MNAGSLARSFPNCQNIFPRVVLLALTAAVLVNAGCMSRTVYFPKESEHWYPKHLRAMMEPSLYEPKPGELNDQFRFLWLRTFHKPVAIRIVKKLAKIQLRAVCLSGAGGFEPGHMEVDRVFTIAESEWNEFLGLVDKISFWRMPTKDPLLGGLDGSQWILEGRVGGNYHMVDRWSPLYPRRPRDAYVECCQFLIRLSKLQVPKEEIY